MAAATVFGTLIPGTGRTTTQRCIRIGVQKYGAMIMLRNWGTLAHRLAPLGFDVDWLDFVGGPQLMDAMRAGQIDFGETGETPPIMAQAAGTDFVYVATDPPSPSGEAIVVPGNSPIQNIAGLKGKKIALNRGSNVHYLLVKALDQARIGYGEIQPVYLPPDQGRAEFEAGRVDAWAIWDPYLAAAQFELSARILVNGAGLAANRHLFLASRAFAAAWPETVRAVIDELVGIDDWGIRSPEDVTVRMAREVRIDPAIMEIGLRRYAFGVEPVSSGLIAYQQQIADRFFDLKLIPHRIDVRDAVWDGKF